jgi:2-dehydro-3-deoxyphosphooctonate aldolase (KDO 8-P synthase)
MAYPNSPEADIEDSPFVEDLHSAEDGIPRRVSPIEIAPGILLGGETRESGVFPIIAGPCVAESEELVLGMADAVASIAEALGLPAIFKSSFDKANRSAGGSSRGPGMEEGLRLLSEARRMTGLPVLTDVHETWQCEKAAAHCDVLQIPAFLCRQTDLIRAAALTGKAVNIKKGQFMAPDDMAKSVDKARATGNGKVFVTERGYSFGYHNLVVDMRSFAIMQGEGIPVVFDVTHSLQLPGGGEVTGGARRFAEPLAKAAIAAGANGVFLEVHPDPERAWSDATTQLPPDRAHRLLASLVRLRRAMRGDA